VRIFLVPDRTLSFLFSVGIELREIGPQVLGLLLVLDAGKNHLGAGNLGPRILDVVEKRGFVPGERSVLVRVAVVEAFGRAGFAARKPIELRAYLVLRVFADGMAGRALSERLLAGGDILPERRSRRTDQQRNHQHDSPCHWRHASWLDISYFCASR
jgi:hypothetical protein